MEMNYESNNNIVYFLSNRCSQTIGGVQTIIRLIEEAMPKQKFVEIPLVHNKKDIKLDKLSNVETYSIALKRVKN